MALNVKKVSQLNEVSYSTVDGSALFYIATNTGDKSYNIQLSNLFLATNNLSTFKFVSDTLTVSQGALNASGTFNLSGALNTGNTAITGTLGVSGTSTLHTLNTGNTAITGTLSVSRTSTLQTLNTGNTAITGTLSVSGNITGNSIIKSGGTSSQFLKADGTIDENSYLITESFNESLSANGWVELPNGLILQWCQGTSQIDDQSQTVTFPKEFPTICLSATTGTLLPSADYNSNLIFQIKSWNKSSVDVYGQGLPDSNKQGKPLIWAIGY